MSLPVKRAKRQTNNQTRVYGAIVDTQRGEVALVGEGHHVFQSIALGLFGPKSMLDMSVGAFSGRRQDRVSSSPFTASGRAKTTAYQWLTGTVLPSLRQRLLPDPEDIVSIYSRVEFYRKHIPWVNRGLVIRSGLNASEFRIDAPGITEAAKAQGEWMLDLKCRLRMFSFMREFFRNLRAYGQTVVLWKTTPRGREPLSIECADPRVYQSRFNPVDGSDPRIVVVPSENDALRQLAADVQSGDTERRKAAQVLLLAYPAPLRDAITDPSIGTHIEVAASDLEPYGYHFEYASLDRRHWEDWGFPGMYSIFPYLEMLMLADDVDINTLHHYKAGILLVQLGPQNPAAGDESFVPGEAELKAIDKKLQEMVKARLPGWAARGDLRISWIVPPDHLMNPSKIASAKEKVLDWLGIPKVAWAGQDLQGAFASAQVSLKFLQQESLDERQIGKELFEGWFHDRAKATNRFGGAVRPVVRFDPNALLEPRIILELTRLFMQSGGADMKTIAEAFGYDAEVWLARRAEITKLAASYGVNFDPAYIPRQKSGASLSSKPEGRPPTVGQPTPEGSEGLPQPRPSVATMADTVERTWGINREEFLQVFSEGFVDPEPS